MPSVAEAELLRLKEAEDRLMDNVLLAIKRVDKSIEKLKQAEDQLNSRAEYVLNKIQKASAKLESQVSFCDASVVKVQRALENIQEAATYIAGIKDMKIEIGEIQATLAGIVQKQTTDMVRG